MGQVCNGVFMQHMDLKRVSSIFVLASMKVHTVWCYGTPHPLERLKKKAIHGLCDLENLCIDLKITKEFEEIKEVFDGMSSLLTAASTGRLSTRALNGVCLARDAMTCCLLPLPSLYIYSKFTRFVFGYLLPMPRICSATSKRIRSNVRALMPWEPGYVEGSQSKHRVKLGPKAIQQDEEEARERVRKQLECELLIPLRMCNASNTALLAAAPDVRHTLLQEQPRADSGLNLLDMQYVMDLDEGEVVGEEEDDGLPSDWQDEDARDFAMDIQAMIRSRCVSISMIVISFILISLQLEKVSKAVQCLLENTKRESQRKMGSNLRRLDRHLRALEIHSGCTSQYCYTASRNFSSLKVPWWCHGWSDQV